MSTSGERRSSGSATGWLVGGILFITIVSVALVARSYPQREALLLVVDKSGSLAGDPMDHVKQACLAANKMLRSGDFIGVLAFDTKPRWVVPLGRAGNEARFRDLIGRLHADGGTDIYPALAEALRAFGSDPYARSARIKRIVLFSDGVTIPADFEGIIKLLAQNGVAVSTICVGSDDFNAPLMSRIAEWGGGRFIFADSTKKLPQFFSGETCRSPR